MAFWAIFKVLITLASISYQRRRQKKMEREAEKRKGFEVVVDGEPMHLPIVYGYQKVAGVRAYHQITDNVEITDPATGFEKSAFPVANWSNGNKPGSLKEYLTVQQAFCFGGIDAFLDFEVDGTSWNEGKFNHLFHSATDGGTADPTATLNGVPATNKFTNAAWSSQIFKLNRNDPNYNGIPDVTAFVRGTKVHTVVESGGNYSLSATKVFSNNPAYVLLDYLLRAKDMGGFGSTISSVNLASFYRAAQICDTVVETNVPVKGRVNGVLPVEEGEAPNLAYRDIKLYEANLTIDTERSVRDNIEFILETMGQSELVYSEGEYKLVCEYPTSVVEQDALITGEYSDDDIVSSKIEVIHGSASDVYNRATVKFLNEEGDFSNDSVSWPKIGSAAHNQYLLEDNGVRNETTIFLHGATHRKSALAKAEQLVRNSRIQYLVKLELLQDALVHEQGDLIKLTSEVADIDGDVFRIEEMKVTDALTVQMVLVRFDYTTLAWNVDDNVVANPRLLISDTIPNVANLAYNSGSRTGEKSNGYLTWDEVTTTNVRRYRVEYKETSGDWKPLGDATENFFDIPADLDGTKDYYFNVRTENASGALSAGVTIFVDNVQALTPITNLVAVDGVNSVRLHWSDPNFTLAKNYAVYVGTTNVRGAATLHGTTTEQEYLVGAINSGSYYFWVDINGYGGAVAAMANPVTGDALAIEPGAVPDTVALAAGVPTNVTLSTTMESDGTSSVKTTFTAGDNAISHELEISHTGNSNKIFATVNGTEHSFTAVPNKQFSIRVRAVNGMGQSAWSAAETITSAVDTVAPAVPSNLVATAGWGQIWLKWNINSESDFEYYDIKQLNNPTTPPPNQGGVPTFSSRTNSILVDNLNDDQSYSFWVRAVDSSGNKSNWTDAVTATTVSLETSQPTPAVPSNLVATTSLIADGQSQIELDWDAANNAVAYMVAYRLDGENYSYIQTATNRFAFDAIPGQSYTFSVLSINNVGVKSNYLSPYSTITAATDNVAPAVPTGLTATAGFENIWVSFDSNSESDFDHYELFEQATVTPAPTAGSAPTQQLRSTSTVIGGLADNITRYFWVRAVDSSGNKSDWSTAVSATTTSKGDIVNQASLQGVIDSTSFASGLTGVEIVNSLPTSGNYEGRTVVLTTDGKLYHYTGGSFKTGVNVADIDGELAADQLSLKAALKGQAVFGFDQDDPHPIQSGAASTVVFEAVDKWSGDHAAHVTYNAASDPSATGQSGGAFVEIAAIIALKFNGKRVRVRGYAKQPTTNAATEFAVVYATNDNGNSGWQRFSPTSSWTAFEFFYDVPAPAQGGSDYLGFWADTSNSGKSVLIDQWTIEVVEDLSNAPGQITETQISDDSISTPKLKANSVTATVIDTGAVIAEKIAVGAVNAEKIAADAVGADKIAANSVNASHLVADSVTAGAIAAGAVGASELAAGSITAEKMAIGDFTNMAAGSTGDWSQHPWTVLTGGGTSSTQFVSGDKSFHLDSTGGTTKAILKLPIFVQEGDSFYVSAMARTSATFDGDGNSKIRIANKENDDVISGVPFDSIPTNVWTLVENQFSVPAGVSELKIELDATHTTGSVWLDDIVIRRMSGGKLIVDGSIDANHVGTNEIVAVAANIKDAIITDAKIADLSAAKLTAGTALAGSITVDGTALSTIDSRASDPAARINVGSTQIQPGKIEIFGTTLDQITDWRYGPDLTLIDGGHVAANSLSANKLNIGQRGVTIESIQFETDGNVLSWTAGDIRYTGNDGNIHNRSISSGSVSWVSATLYVYYNQGSNSLFTTNDAATAFGSNVIVLAIYKGGNDLVTQIGRTVIDGDHIKTGTVDTQHLAAGSIVADKLSTGELITVTGQIKDAIITDAKIADLSAAKLTAGTALAASITVDGSTLETVRDNSEKVEKFRSMGALAPSFAWTTGSIVYATFEPNTVIFKNGEIQVEAASATTGTFSVVEGDVIESNKPITVSHNRDLLGSFAMAGKQFIDKWTRTSGYQIMVKSISSEATVTLSASGQTDVTATVPAGGFLKISTGWTWTSSVDVTITSTADVAVVRNISTLQDAACLWPVARKWLGPKLYKPSFSGSGATITDTSGSTALGLIDFGHGGLGAATAVGDGSGNDCESAVPLDALASSYVFCHDVADYAVAAVEPCLIRVYDNSGTLQATHDLSAASLSNPMAVEVGPQSGNGSPLYGAGAYVIGTAPFYLRTNNPAGDAEYAMRGWRDDLRTSFAASLTDVGSNVAKWASDPAARVNSGSTQIDPGKIVVSGATTLADWRMAGDETKIDGGNISTNTISANKLNIGQRGVAVEGIQFETNGNVLSWTAGDVRYTGNDGNIHSRSTSAGSVSWVSGTLYVYYNQGSSALFTTTDPATAFGSNVIVLAVYRGGNDLVTQIGRTVIDGDHIKTGSIESTHIKAGQVITSTLRSNNYVAGTSGFSLNEDGTLEIQNLIARDAIIDGAVTDGGVHTSYTSAGQLNDGTDCGQLTLGGWQLGQLWNLAYRANYRHHSFVFNGTNKLTYATRLHFQYRTKTGTTWSSWITLDTSPWSTSEITWSLASGVYSLQGIYDDVQMRTQVQVANIVLEPSSGSGTQNFLNIQNSSYLGKAIVK